MSVAPKQQEGMSRQEAIMIKQEWAVLEAVVGLEAKNRYRVHRSTPDPHDTGIEGPAVMYIAEKSDCLQRILCGPNRRLTLTVHLGGSEQGETLLKLHKPFHLQFCCLNACRPRLDVEDGNGTHLGRVEDPFKCCVMNQKIFDANDDLKYETSGSVCQIAMCCPCLGQVKFKVTSLTGGASGSVTKVFDGCSEICLGTNKFKVVYPTDATKEDQKMILAAAMLLDLEYFESKKQSGPAGSPTVTLG